jgi:hypothetical protein
MKFYGPPDLIHQTIRADFKQGGRYSHISKSPPAQPGITEKQGLEFTLQVPSGEQLAQGPGVLMQNRKKAVDHFGG